MNKPFYIAIYDAEICFDDDRAIDDYTIIRKLDKPLKFNVEILKIDDKYYKKSIFAIGINTLFVEEVREPERCFERGGEQSPVCPNCGNKFENDEWSVNDFIEEECEVCGSKIKFYKYVNIEYSSEISWEKPIREL